MGNNNRTVGHTVDYGADEEKCIRCNNEEEKQTVRCDSGRHWRII